MAASLNQANSDSTPVTEPEPCPTPLQWNVVVDEFRKRRQVETVDAADVPALPVATLGTGPALYILGPAAGDCELFALLAWLLKDEYCSVLVDLPHIGWPVRCLAELQRQTAAVLSAADQLQHERFAVLGVGPGGTVAIDLCVNAPQRAAALALLQGSASLELSGLERGFYAYGSLLPGTLGVIPGWRGLQQRNHRPWFPPFDSSRFDFLLQNLASTPTAQASRRMLLWAGLDFRPQLSALKQPGLVIRTEGESRAARDGMQTLQTGMPNAQVEELHSTGVFPYLTHPHRVAKLLRSFLQDVR